MTETLPTIPDPRPPLPFGIVWAMGSWVDGDTSDDGRHPDVHPLAGVRVRFELSHRVLVSQFGGHREIHLKRPVDAEFDHRGVLQRVPDTGDPDFQAPATELGVPLLPTNSPHIQYLGSGEPRWTVSPRDASGFPKLTFTLSEGQVLDLADVLAAGGVPGDGQDTIYRSLLDAAADLRAAIQAGTTGIDRIEQVGDSTVDFVLVDGSRYPVTIPGRPGKSAYETAVDQGFVGSEADWLASLKGESAPLPEVSWDGPFLTVGGQTSGYLGGPPGPANELSIGTVQGGEEAAASITGTAPEQALHLTLPRGDDARPRYVDVPVITGSIAITEAHEGMRLLVQSATPVTLTLPATFPLGGVVDWTQDGEGSVTASASAILCSGQPITRTQGSTVTATFLGAGRWAIDGDVIV